MWNQFGYFFISASLFTLGHWILVEGYAFMFGKTVYGTTFKDVHFLPLQSATFCIQCELISTNSRPYCLACGNTSLLSLSRVLGGSLRNQQTAHLITDSELDSLVRDLLRTVPDPQVMSIADHHARYLRSLCAASFA